MPLVSSPSRFAASQQNALRYTHMAVPIGSTTSGRRVEVLLQTGAPDAKLGATVTSEQKVSSRFASFARFDGAGGLDSLVSQTLFQWCDHLIEDADRAAVQHQLPQVTAVDFPGGFERTPFRAGRLWEQSQPGKFLLRLEPHKRFRERWANKLSIAKEIKRHEIPQARS
jgi:hypothetical protein